MRDLRAGPTARAVPERPGLRSVPRIRDVDAVLRARGADVHRWVVESHPEVVFASLHNRDPGLSTKKSAAGALARIELLRTALGRPLPDDVPAGAALDDALDAVACALAARRWADGVAEVLGGGSDAEGLPMRIVV